MGYQQLTVSGTALALTVPTGATIALLTVESNAVRFRDDGVAPTASVGFPLSVSAGGVSSFEYSGNLSQVLIISQTGSATVDILYYRVAG